MTDDVARYIERTAACLSSIAATEVESVYDAIAAARDSGALILMAGNGGSAAIASHFACDLAKVGHSARAFRAIALTDNVPLLTMWANDAGYERVFAEQVWALGRRGDALLVVSGSGNSPNVLAALDAAAEIGMTRLALLGFDGGRAKARVDACVHVRSTDYGQIEVAHSMITHLLTERLATQAAR